MLILGLVCLALARSLPRISPETGAMLLDTSMGNINLLIEELGLRVKAIYLPSSLTSSGKPQALLPLSSDIDTKWLDRPLPQRLIVKYGPNNENVGILVSTPGSVSAVLLAAEDISGMDAIESSLTHVLVGLLDAVGGVRVSQSNDGDLTIRISGSRLDGENVALYEWLGTPLASIVASIAAEAMDKPVRILEETQNKKHIDIRIGVA
ncbi:MAG: hypothetical protein HN929_00635 [Chloroflexi bacterium]|nr:hypothetical protein [Chloroflexota bacterium]MBT7079972.1 hypothetical protein [Chloroflexota bacterium]MBT7289498.1 hypothetical protein [Chloroflexota bacterium]